MVRYPQFPAKVINPVRKLTNKKNKKIYEVHYKGMKDIKVAKLPALNNH